MQKSLISKRRTAMKNLPCLRFTLVCALIILPMLSHADVLIKQKQHTDDFEMMGQKQPAKDVITTIWMTKDKIRSDNEERSFIFLADKGITYILDHKKKTYIEMSADMNPMAGDMTKKEAAGFNNMMKNMMKMEITITPTGEKKKIGKWNCTKYLQKLQTMMGPMNSEVWASEDIQIDNTLYAHFAASMFAQMTGMQNAVEAMMKEMKKIKGVPVLTISSNTVMGQTINSSTELLEVKEEKAPAGIFDLPKGYRKETMK